MLTFPAHEGLRVRGCGVLVRWIILLTVLEPALGLEVARPDLGKAGQLCLASSIKGLDVGAGVVQGCVDSALKQSKAYVQGYWTPVAGRLFLVFLIWFATNASNAVILKIVNPTKNRLIEEATFAGLNFFILIPFIQTYGIHLYQNLKIIYEAKVA